MPSARQMTTPVAIAHELIEGRYADLGGYTVAFERFPKDVDPAPYFAGLPGDRCTCPHWGVVTSGQITFRWADREETYGEGDAYYAPPGHLPLIAAGTSVVEFSPAGELAAVQRVVGAHLSAERFVRWLETGEDPGDLFAPEAFGDLSVPQWRVQADNAKDLMELRTRSHPLPGKVTVERFEPTARGWVMQMTERWTDLRDPKARLQAYLWGLTVAFELLDLPRIHRNLRALEDLGAENAEARFFAASRRLAADLLLGRLDTAAYLLEIADEAAGQAFVADREGVRHAMTAYPAMLRGDVATCVAEAEAYKEFARAEGAPTVLAEGGLLWAVAGRADRAAAVAGQFGGDTLAGLPTDMDWLLVIQCVLEAALAGGVREVVAAAVELLTPYEGRAVINAGAVMFHGTTDDTLCRGNALLGNETAAARQRARALATYRRIGAVWWRERLEAGPGRSVRMRLCRTETGLWTVGPEAAPATLPGMRGLSYLHRLLTRPGTEVAALDLTGPQTVRQGGTGPAADPKALAAYRRRLATAPPAERAAIEAHLHSVTGLGGRLREESGSSAERARVAVRKAIVAALARIAEVQPELGRHLYDRVSTGTSCRYDPDPAAPITWLLS